MLLVNKILSNYTIPGESEERLDVWMVRTGSNEVFNG